MGQTPNIGLSSFMITISLNEKLEIYIFFLLLFAPSLLLNNYFHHEAQAKIGFPEMMTLVYFIGTQQ